MISFSFIALKTLNCGLTYLLTAKYSRALVDKPDTEPAIKAAIATSNEEWGKLWILRFSVAFLSEFEKVFRRCCYKNWRMLSNIENSRAMNVIKDRPYSPMPW